MRTIDYIEKELMKCAEIARTDEFHEYLKKTRFSACSVEEKLVCRENILDFIIKTATNEQLALITLVFFETEMEKTMKQVAIDQLLAMFSKEQPK